MTATVGLPTPAASSGDDPQKFFADRIRKAKEARRPQEKTWLSNLAFAAGQHWLVWDAQGDGRLRHIAEMDPRYRDRTLYTADRIREYLQAQLGELAADDDRPSLLTAQEGDTAEEVAKELNDAVGYSWRYESKAAEALERARRGSLTMGVSAIRARYDTSCGPVVDRQPVDQTGAPVKDGSALDMLEQHGTLPDGSLPKFTPIHEGRTTLEAYTAFQILTPPGLTHEDDFPWEVLVRPVFLDDVKDEYPKAADLTEDTDIASAAGLSTGQGTSGMPMSSGPSGTTRLRDHVWLYTCFRKPCKKYPNGQQVVLAGNQYKLLDAKDELPYKTADGTPHSGIVYFHWWRLDDRFWSRAFIEPMKDPQRLINDWETSNAELIRRGVQKLAVRKGDFVNTPGSEPMEIVELEEGAQPPIPIGGYGPGPWMWTALEHAAENLSHASTLSPIRIGENPQSVDTYSQFYALNENEGRKRDSIQVDHRRQTAKLVEFHVHDIREWWPDAKTIVVSGEDDSISQQTFEKSKVPDFFLVNQAEGPAAPRSGAAEIKKIDAIWQAALASAVVTGDPVGWTSWYAESLKAGKALELPEPPKESQERFAEFENFLMQNGEEVDPAYYDLAPVHLPKHREAQDNARAAGDIQLVARLERHIQATLQIQQQVVEQQAAIAATAVPEPPQPGQQPGQQGPPQTPPGQA